MIELKCNEAEAQVLANMIDVAVKAGGIRLAKPAAVWIDKLEAAMASHQQSLTSDDNDKVVDMKEASNG